jgi:hypothetical protein
MLAIRIELDAGHGRRALGVSADAPVELLAIAAAVTDVRTRLTERLAAAYPGAKITVAIRLGPYGAGRTRVRLTAGTATWRRGEGSRVVIAECAEALRDAVIAEAAEEAAKRRRVAALNAAAAAADIRNFAVAQHA